MIFNKNTKTKALSLLLAACAIGASLISCTNTQDGKETDTNQSSVTTTSADSTTSADTTNEYLDVNIPSFDFAGSDLSVYLTLPSDLFSRDYKEGLTLLGTPDDAALEKEIKEQLKALATQKDAPEGATVEDGDTVIMDYVGKLDGVAFSGGTATDSEHDISIEKSTFIDGFDRGLLGMKAGETKDLNLTFPDPYPNNTSLAGKAVVFTVTVDKIIKYEIPELTDKLISDNQKFFGEEVKTAAEYKASVKDALTEHNKNTDENSILEAAWKYATEKTEFKSYPDGLLEGYTEAFYADYYNMALSYGMTMEQLAQEEGYLTVEDYKKSVIEENAKSYINERMVLYHACKEAGISISDEEAKKEAEAEFKENIEPNLSVYTQYYGIENVDDYIEYRGGLESFRENTMFAHLIYKIAGLEMPKTE